MCLVCFKEAPIVGIFIKCCHACLCFDCISLINEKRKKNRKVNCVAHATVMVQEKFILLKKIPARF